MLVHGRNQNTSFSVEGMHARKRARTQTQKQSTDGLVLHASLTWICCCRRLILCCCCRSCCCCRAICRTECTTTRYSRHGMCVAVTVCYLVFVQGLREAVEVSEVPVARQRVSPLPSCKILKGSSDPDMWPNTVEPVCVSVIQSFPSHWRTSFSIFRLCLLNLLSS